MPVIVQVFHSIPVNTELLGKMGILGSSYPKSCAVGGSWREVLERQLERKVGKEASCISERPIYCWTYLMLPSPGSFLKKQRHSFGQGRLWTKAAIEKSADPKVRRLKSEMS